MKAVYPLPEAVDPKPQRVWQIQSPPPVGCCPRVYVNQSLLLVPLDDSPQARLVRSHELGHIRWSPARPELAARRHKLDMDVLQAVEDMRINTKLVHIGVDTRQGAVSLNTLKTLAENLLRSEDVRYLILAAVAITGQGRDDGLFKEILSSHPAGKQAVEIARMAREILWTKGNPLFRGTLRTAKWLQALLDALMPPAPIHLPRWWDRGEKQATLSRICKIARQFGTGPGATRKVPWGKMKMETPPRCRLVDGYLGKRKTASEEGVLLRHPHRLLIDGRVFSRTRRYRGGSVLVDCSGSMSLTAEDLKTILHHAPGAVVACYSGYHSDGVLRILAQDGRQVNDEFVTAPAGGANVIDAPALQWLSQQPKPRIWVSDGQVTGIGDRQSALNSLECEGLCRQSGIVRLDTVQQAVEFLQRLRRSRNQ